jgi:hypothetical protein
MEARDQRSSQNMREWATILAPLAAAIIPNLFNKQSGPTLAELTTTLQNMKTLSGAGESAASKITELKDLLEVVRGLDPPEKSGSTWVDLIRDTAKEVGPPLMAMVTARAGQAAPAMTARGTVESATNPQLTRAAEPAEDPMLQFLGWLREQLAALIHQASLNKDPGLYAEVVVDNLPAGVDPRLLRDQLAKADWWATMANFAPGVQPYPQWFAECREEMLRLLNDMMAAPVAPAPVAQKPKVKKSGVQQLRPMPSDADDSSNE